METVDGNHITWICMIKRPELYYESMVQTTDEMNKGFKDIQIILFELP